MLNRIAIGVFTSFLLIQQASAVIVPGSVPPVRLTTVGLYADDSRGIAVPEHDQLVLQDNRDLLFQAKKYSDDGVTFSDASGNDITPQANQEGSTFDGEHDVFNEIERIANDVGYQSQSNGQNMSGGVDVLEMTDIPMQAFDSGVQAYGNGGSQQSQVQRGELGGYSTQQSQVQRGGADGYSTEYRTVPTPTGNRLGLSSSRGDNGVEIASGRAKTKYLDMKNSIVNLKEDRIAVRRIIRRMLDQIGGASWDVVWNLSAENASLPEMEVSIFTQEPFMNVLNALLARLQTRSGQSLRVVRYDNSQKLVITDQQGKIQAKTKAAGVRADGKMIVTEQVLKESKVVLHYDEIPLVDALENMVNQASRGQWRLRVYAGMDQVLKPAHIEEPFNIAMERILGLFNLKYEIFPGGKLVVITSGGATSYTNMQQY